MTRFWLPAPAPYADMAQKATTGTQMNNSPYLDQPFVPLAVALRSMLAETEARISIIPPAEKWRLQQRAEVLRESLTPKPTVPRSS